MALRFSKDGYDEHLNALLHHRETDPFLDWLKTLPPWDEKTRLANLLQECLGAVDGPLTRWASCYLIVGPCQRANEPGCLLREIPILIGHQRIGKSQFFRSLLPPDEPDWFSDSLCMSESSQKMVESLLGRVIVEISELTGFRRADLESLKSFISRRDDGSIRLAYRRDPETLQRRCILVGTTNDRECLPNDPTGNSRYVPIQCGVPTKPVEPYLNENRIQIWAEGLAYYRGGIRANVPRRLMELQGEHAEKHRRKDGVIEDSITKIAGEGPLTIGTICAAVDLDKRDTRAVTRLCAALRLAGWTKKRGRHPIDSNLCYLWFRPVPPTRSD